MMLWHVGVIFTVILLFGTSFSENQDQNGADEPRDEPSFAKPVYKPPVPIGDTHFFEAFESIDDFESRWVLSSAKKDGKDEAIAKYDGKWEVENPKETSLEGDLGLVLKSRAKHHAVSVKLNKPFQFSGKPLIVQYEVKFQNGIECGGAYIKLLTDSMTLKLPEYGDKTPYTIMFGPDKCGMDFKLHFIFRHKNPVTGEIEEKHAKKPTAKIDNYYTDKKTHVYTLVVNPDNTFEMLIDQQSVNSGSLLEDFEPSVNPPKEIEDRDDKKSEDWDEKERITDPDAEKPEDWDETQTEKIEDVDAKKPTGWLDDEQDLIPDPDATMPDDWDKEMDGEWEAPKIENTKCKEAPGCGLWKTPMIKNPLYKGKWKAPMIDNPSYKGVWKPRKIANPAFFEDLQPYKMMPFAAIGLELWTMTEDILFDNFIITDDRAVADQWTEDSWVFKRNAELAASASSSKSVVDGIVDMTRERPWLWAVFIVVFVLPVILIIAYCCIPSNKDSKVDDFKKKLDEPNPDDEPEPESEPEPEPEFEVADDNEAAKDTKTVETEQQPAQENAAEDKDDSIDEVDEEEEEEEEENDTSKAAGDTGIRKRAVKKSDLEKKENTDEEEIEEDNEESTENSSPRKSPRKRKSRRD